MAQPLSEYLGVRPQDLTRLGVLDSIVGVDTNLFVDPHLLRRTSAPEFRGAAVLMELYFEDVLGTLQRSQRKDDQDWREARKRLAFPETRGVSIGYSVTRSDGSAIGRVLASRLVETASEIIGLGVADPVIFELIGLFEIGFGADRLSDMTLHILKNNLLRYSVRISRELGLFETRTFPTTIGRIELPQHPNGRDPLLFLPADVLSELPVAFAFDGVDNVIARNYEVRKAINQIVGRAWRRRQALSKALLRRTLLRNGDAMIALVRAYKKDRRGPYDMKRDPSGLMRWYFEGRRIAALERLRIRLPPLPTLDDLAKTVESIIARFKRLVERGKLDKQLYPSHAGYRSRPRERYVQRLFYSITDAYCTANNLAVVCEPDPRDGPVRIYSAHDSKLQVLVHVKLSSNPHLRRLLARSLTSSPPTGLFTRMFYVVIRITESGDGMRAARELRVEKIGHSPSALVEIDGRSPALRERVGGRSQRSRGHVGAVGAKTRRH